MQLEPRMQKQRIYLDNAATTKLDPYVLEQMLPYLQDDYGNPASTHYFGKIALNAVENSRKQIANSIGCDSKEIIFTSGATEATNLALIGASSFYQARGRHLITLTTEHKATLDTMKYLESIGFSVTYVSPGPDGLLDLATLKSAITPETILISIAFVNSEIGVIQDIEAIGGLCKEHDVILHVDAAQACGKIDFNLTDLNIGLMSMSSHKIHGPKGVGALYVRRHPRIRLNPILYGGGQERGLRSGTLATHQIVGMGAAFELASKNFNQDIAYINSLTKKLMHGLNQIPGVFYNGSLSKRISHNINVGFVGIDANLLLQQMENVFVASMSSACTSALLEPSYVLKALGLVDQECFSSIRLSLSKFNTIEEIDFVVKSLIEYIKEI